MNNSVSKSQLKAQLLEYLRKLEESREPIIITHLGQPVAQITYYQKNALDALKELRESVLYFEYPVLDEEQRMGSL